MLEPIHKYPRTPHLEGSRLQPGDEDLDAVPLAPGVAGVARALGRDPAAFAASGGEDYELIVALPGDAPAPDGVPLVRVGTLTAEPGVRAQPAGRLDPAHLGWRHRVGDA